MAGLETLLQEKLKLGVKNRLFPGGVVGVVKENGERIFVPYGRIQYSKNSPKVSANTIYDVASVTKSIPVATLLLMAIDKKLIDLNDKIIDFLPEFKKRDKKEITVKHLLTYTLDFDFKLPFSKLKNTGAKQLLEMVFTTKLKCKPGTRFVYSNATAIIMGLLVERIFGASLEEVSRRYLFKPLKMGRSTFLPLCAFNKREIAPTEVSKTRGIIQGIVHDPSSFILSSVSPCGASGLFSTAHDLLNFLETLINKDKYLLSKIILSQMSRDQTGNLKAKFGLGWAVKRPYMGNLASVKTIGKSGFTGCSVICDLQNKVGIVFLSNCTYPKGKPVFEKYELMKEISDLIHEFF